MDMSKVKIAEAARFCEELEAATKSVYTHFESLDASRIANINAGSFGNFQRGITEEGAPIYTMDLMSERVRGLKHRYSMEKRKNGIKISVTEIERDGKAIADKEVFLAVINRNSFGLQSVEAAQTLVCKCQINADTQRVNFGTNRRYVLRTTEKVARNSRQHLESTMRELRGALRNFMKYSEMKKEVTLPSVSIILGEPKRAFRI